MKLVSDKRVIDLIRPRLRCAIFGAIDSTTDSSFHEVISPISTKSIWQYLAVVGTVDTDKFDQFYWRYSKIRDKFPKFASFNVNRTRRVGISMSFPKFHGHPALSLDAATKSCLKQETAREQKGKGKRKGGGVGNICGQVAKRVRLSTSVSGGAMVVVMVTLGAPARSQPPDLQGVQIDARRRNNRRIGPRGSAEGDLMERILSRCRSPHSSLATDTSSPYLPLLLPPAFCDGGTLLYPFYFLSQWLRTSAHCGSIRRVARTLRDEMGRRVVSKV